MYEAKEVAENFDTKPTREFRIHGSIVNGHQLRVMTEGEYTYRPITDAQQLDLIRANKHRALHDGIPVVISRHGISLNC